jgi:hypothetical protein
MTVPKIDNRDAEAILKQISEMVPFYTPEWNYKTKDAGFALLKIFAQIFEGIIGRLNRVPDKGFIEFLNMAGVGLLPAQQARAPLVFNLSKGAPEPVLIPTGVQAAAKTDNGEQILFETDGNMLATTAKLIELYSTDPDKIYKAPPDFLTGGKDIKPFAVFAGKDLQEHVVYIGHNDLFSLESQTEIELISSKWNPAFKNNSLVKWEYYGEKEYQTDGTKAKKENWHSLDIDTDDSQKLVLRKKQTGKFKELEIDGIKSRWIRCTSISPAMRQQKASLKAFKITVKPLSLTEGKAEKAYFNSEEKAIYIASDILSKIKGRAGIELRFSNQRLKLNDRKVFLWQYYGVRSGEEGWYTLNTNDTPAGRVVLVKDNSDELKEHKIGSYSSYWLRCQLNLKETENKEIMELLELKHPWAGFAGNFPPHIRLLFQKALDNNNLSFFIETGESPKNKVPYPGLEKIILDQGKTVLDFDNVTKQLAGDIEEYLDKNIRGVEISVQNPPYVEPEMIFYNDVPLELPSQSTLLCPFGKQPKTFDIFYLASPDALSKKGSRITLEIDTAETTDKLPVGFVQGIGPDFVDQLINHKLDDGTPDPIDTIRKLLKKTPRELSQILTSTTKDKGEISIGLKRAMNILEAAQKEFHDKTGIFQPINETKIFPTEEILMLSWEYWNGTGWRALAGITDKTNKLRENGTVIFDCPEDLAATTVNGQENLWVRIKIASGDYGRERFMSSDGKTWQSDTSQISPPKVSGLRIKYDALSLYPDRCIIKNNLLSEDITDALLKSAKPLNPFQFIDDRHCSIYLGFDTPPLKGPIKIFFSLREVEYTNENRPVIEWEYYREQRDTGEWAKLDALDGTDSLTESGILEFVGLPDFTKTTRFGQKLYWIRAVDIRDSFKDKALSPIINGIYLNASWATQTETVQGEILGSSDGEAGQTFSMSKAPFVSEIIWVDELKSLSAAEMESIVISGRDTVKETEDGGINTGFWVRWDPVSDFLESGTSDRHYLVDKAAGKISFGDGIKGTVPPSGSNNIKADYKAGGGAAGNVGRYEITSLKTSIAFVDSVYNPETADGGSDLETVGQALKRGPRILKHQDRAVTAEDFEWLALEASRNIARAKCLPNINDQNQTKPGWITVIIVPKSNQDKPVPSLRLKKQVKSYLKDRTANVISMPGNIHIRGPAFQEISVTATLIAVSMDDLPLVEKESLDSLTSVLHPLTGGKDGNGWEFGRYPSLSDFFTLLESIQGIDHVESLSLIIRDEDGKETKVDSAHPLNLPFSPINLVFSGKHNITVKTTAG